MDQRLSFITLAVADVARSRAFFVDGLGWQESLYVPGEVLMLRVGERLVLSLWDRVAFEAEVGPIASGTGVPPLTLAHNVASPADVDEVIEEAVAAGATLRSAGAEREWGGYSGYVVDPDGFAWEIAYNPGPIGQDLLP
ncbi:MULTISPECIES: VOC family protein [Mumia]|uniref:VOC family protein n=1 Tax=Mumia TaxID=1546255 RepID=UPI00142110D2|nr:VOC family protein [Mumia sp. ZJ1417]QMW66022.1 VOC family protein [Mumia sp. ZJ1417]